MPLPLLLISLLLSLLLLLLLLLSALKFPIRLVPSSGARAGGKARMFEAMDGRVRAGPVMASSAGDRAGSFRAARDWGALLFGYFLLGKQEKVTRCPQGAKALDLDLDLAVAPEGTTTP